MLLYVLVFIIAGTGIHVGLNAQAGARASAGSDPLALLQLLLIPALRVLLILGIATSFGLHIAGRFLGDVFELRDDRVAWRYVGSLAGGTKPGTLHLRQGRLAEADRNLPIIQIGGPGLVVVDPETAVLFEKPDGTPHVIRGNASEGASAFIEGFERLREPVISLRDQYVGAPSGEPFAVVGRSLDGMPISVTDVTGLFSVRRDPAPAQGKSSTGRAIASGAQDIQNLIYTQTVPVLTGEEHASGTPGDWTRSMYALIRESLRSFMAENRLTEFLAGVGAHETERSEFRADTILSQSIRVSGGTVALPAAIFPAPRFRPRTELSAKFKKHGSEFSTMAQGLGLELHWIGVGTWKMPDDASETTISAKHAEAWRLNRENTQRTSSESLEQIAEESLSATKLRLIQDVPLARHEAHKARFSDKSVLMECMLQDFWEQLGEALDIYYRNSTAAPEVEELEEAVLEIERLLKPSQPGHILESGTMSRVRPRDQRNVRKDPPPAPASRSEAAKYQLLLNRLEGDYRVAEAMIANEKRRHGDLNREQLITRIVGRFERHGH